MEITGNTLSVALFAGQVIIGILGFSVKASMKRIEKERDARDGILNNLSKTISDNTLEVSTRLTKIETSMEDSGGERSRLLGEVASLHHEIGEMRGRLESVKERMNSLENRSGVENRK